MPGFLPKTSRLWVAATLLFSLSLAGCWNNEVSEAPTGETTVTDADDNTAALREIAEFVREGDAYCGIVADLDKELETPVALRYKSIVERAARVELEFEKNLARLDVEELLGPQSMSSFESRQQSVTSINELSKLYTDHVADGGEHALDAIRFFVNIGAALDFDPVEVIQSDIDALAEYLKAMVQAYGVVVVTCNDADVKLESGRLLFNSTQALRRYNEAVADAQHAESEFQTAYQAVLGARQRMIDRAINATANPVTEQSGS